MEKMTFNDFTKRMTDIYKEDPKSKTTGVIVFTAESFGKPYTEEQRSYRTNVQQKYFDPSKIGNSLFADCIDGTDNGVRLDYYIPNWKVEYCYIEKR